jgi:trimethylamine:corrinoid methyltransferase-like protein
MKYLRAERYPSRLIRPEVRDDWVANGSVTFMEMVREEAEKILKEHHPEPLDEASNKELDRLIAAAEKEFSA